MLRHLFLLVSLLPRLLAAQEAWAPPPMVEWPLLDLSVFHRPASVELFVAPSVGAEPVPDVRVGLAALVLPAESLPPWLERAWSLYRAATDSGPAGHTVLEGALTLPGEETFLVLRLGYDRAHRRHLGLFFLSLEDSLGHNLWTAYASAAAAAGLLTALARPAQIPPAMFDDQAPGHLDLDRCTTASQPSNPSLPRLRPPPGARFGGRVLLQYLVDSTGRIPLDRVEVLLTSGPAYTSEVRWVMERIRYHPARCDKRRVAVVVRQGLRFPPPDRGR